MREPVLDKRMEGLETVATTFCIGLVKCETRCNPENRVKLATTLQWIFGRMHPYRTP